MQNEIREYAEAVQANLLASESESQAKETKRQAYYRLMRAKDALRTREREILEQVDLI